MTKKIVEINGTNYSSTGNIMNNIAREARKEGFEVFTCCKASRKSKEFKYDNQIYIGNRYERLLSEYLAKFFGYSNYYNYFGTKKFIKKLDEIKPDLINLHIIHDTYMNLNMFFDYVKKKNIKIVWTFHDCWAFTGRCPHFEIANCYKWKTGCYDCPQLDKYPITNIDRSKLLWAKKREWFTNIKNMAIVTPSSWLLNYVKKSYFCSYPSQIIYNGIDLNVFKICESDFRKKYSINRKYIILGVGYNWAPRKGLNYFIELAKRLSNDYQIVLVGTNNEIDKTLPKSILSIHRTYNQKDLVEIYSAADLFVNPTLEDSFPTVNLEALACGTPVLTYNTGGSPEAIDETCGSVVDKGDINSLEKEIVRICNTKPYSKENCVKRAHNFDATNKFKEYVELYKHILNK